MSAIQETLTLEETNKVRISLGLKPITDDTDGAVGDDGEPEVDEDEVAEANFAARRAEEKRVKEENEVKERIEKARNRAALNAKLKGTTLGDANADDSLSAKNWIKQQKKRAKKREQELASKRQRELDEQDKAVYDESDLAGLKVAHGADDFVEGEEVILTLKDSRVLEGDEDELQNVNMADDDADKAAKERKRKATEAYTGYDDDEFDDNRIGKRAEVLAKYDEEFSGGKVKSEGFRLGGPPVEKKVKVTDDDDVEMVGAPATKVKLDLNFAKDFEVSDYMKEGDPGFKKPKKRRAKKSTRRADDEDEEAMDVDAVPTFTRRVVGDGPDNLVDDDDLQAALARSRRENAKKRPKVKPEDLAAQIAQLKQEDEMAAAAAPDDGDDDGRITFDETSEFVRNVAVESRAVPVKQERAALTSEPVVVKIERGEEGGPSTTNGAGVEDEAMESDDEEEDEALAEMAAREGLSLAEYRIRIDSQMQELAEIKAEDIMDGSTSTDPEPVVSQGMAGVLALLKNQGTVSKRNPEDEDREKRQKQHDLWLADHRRRLAQRELERIQARGGNKDQAQREYDNRMREQQEARDALESYKNYKPDINIVYHDEFGRAMTPKEAWKSLSHKFHGKTSGRMKTEKRLRKIEEERKQQSMGASDTPLGMTDAFARRQQKTGEAHMVLSVGNKGSVQATKNKGRR